jgi:lipopolysaccharide export system permease protein
MFLMMLGTDWLASGAIPGLLGLWWLVLPLLAAAAWLYSRDGRLPRRGARA